MKVILTETQLNQLEELATQFSVAEEILDEVDQATGMVNLTNLDGELREWLEEWLEDWIGA